MAGTFELRDHTADIAVRATGEDLGACCAAVADGLAAAMCEDVPRGGDRYEVAVRAENREALLFEYLDELIYQRDVRSVLPVDHAADVDRVGGDGAGNGNGNRTGTDDGRTGSSHENESDDGNENESDDGNENESDDGNENESDDGCTAAWRLSGSYRGVPLDAVVAREVKAVTYSEMRVERTDAGWTAYVVFDV